MQIIVDANGDGTFKHTDMGIQMSVYTMIMPGEHDDKLAWPYTGTVTIEVENWETDRHHLQSKVWYSTVRALGYGNRPTGEEGNSTWVMASPAKRSVENGNMKHLYICSDILYLKVFLR